MFTVGNLDALLYCFQQLGVMVSVGAETVILIAYMFVTKDGVIDDTEARFSKAIRRALGAGIATIVISGIAITALHSSLGEGSIIFQPAFLFKWLLVLILATAYFVQSKRPFLHYSWEGAVGATWYALFLVHILAPITTWIILFIAYAIFSGLFEGIWVWLVTSRNRAHQPMVLAAAGSMSAPMQINQSYAPVPVQKPAPPPPAPQAAPMPKPVPPPPPPAVEPPPPPTPVLPAPVVPPAVPKPPVLVQPVSVPAGPPMKEAQENPLPISMPETFTPMLPEQPAPPPPPPIIADHDPHSSPWLPAIHVMPKSKEDLDAKTHVTPFADSKHA